MASGMRSDPELFMNNHRIDCRFRILVLGKVRTHAMAHLAVNLTSTITTASVWKVFTHQHRLRC